MLLAPARRLYRLPLLAAVVLAIALLLPTLSAPGPAYAATGLVQTLGVATTNNGTSVTITTTGAVTAGDSIIVAVGTIDGIATIGCSDATNGTYNVDVSGGGGNAVTVICSVPSSQHLSSGTTITITSSGATAIYASAAEFSGLAASSTLDRTASNSGTGASMSVTLGAATSQSDELLIGAFNDLDSAGTTTAGTNGTSNNCANTSSTTYSALPSASALSGAEVMSWEYCIVSASATYQAAATYSTAPASGWVALVASYRVLEPTTTPTASSTSTPTGTPTNTPTITLTSTPTNSPTNTPTASATLTSTATPTRATGSDTIYLPFVYPLPPGATPPPWPFQTGREQGGGW
jgi:hypothetical protein